MARLWWPAAAVLTRPSGSSSSERTRCQARSGSEFWDIRPSYSRKRGGSVTDEHHDVLVVIEMSEHGERVRLDLARTSPRSSRLGRSLLGRRDRIRADRRLGV